ATGDQEYRRVAEETLDYILREMTHPEGGFYSSQDADSEGEEGKFFAWTPEEVRAALGDSQETRVALGYWGFTVAAFCGADETGRPKGRLGKSGLLAMYAAAGLG
ncbi:MAG: hypothetical protein AAB284_02655, partial [Chloroflexota bacterium]